MLYLHIDWGILEDMNIDNYYIHFLEGKFQCLLQPSAFRSVNNILISCTFRYDKDDYNGLLGLDKIFKLTSATGAPYSGLHFGVVAKTMDRNGIPQLAPCFTSSYSTTGMGNYGSIQVQIIQIMYLLVCH